jgi:hypothetical protein
MQGLVIDALIPANCRLTAQQDQARTDNEKQLFVSVAWLWRLFEHVNDVLTLQCR